MGVRAVILFLHNNRRFLLLKTDLLDVKPLLGHFHLMLYGFLAEVGGWALLLLWLRRGWEQEVVSVLCHAESVE